MESTNYTTENLLNEFFLDRKIFIKGGITDETAFNFILLVNKLQKKSKEPIYVFIDSVGGDIQAGLSIIDTIQYSTVPIYTFCYSLAASMAAIILAAGDRRFAYKHSTIMIHQPLTYCSEGYKNQTKMMESAKKLEEKRIEIEKMLTKFTKGKTSYAKMHKACDFDNYLSSEEALKMGLIDEIVSGTKTNNI